MNNKIKKEVTGEILRKIEIKPNSNQRDLAHKLDISLGKINYCLKELKKRGLIKIKNFKNNPKKLNYKYLLTTKGVSYKSKMIFYFMRQKIKEYNDLKNEVKKIQDN
jgi:EPS-associated MarR family transcriptional regulator